MTDAQLQRIEDLVVGLGQSGARHEKWLESIDQRFGTLNGTVASLTKDSIAAKMFQAEHAKTVEQIDVLLARAAQQDREIAGIRADQASDQNAAAAAEKVNAKYRKWFGPWIDRAIWALLALLLWNGQTILKAVGLRVGG